MQLDAQRTAPCFGTATEATYCIEWNNSTKLIGLSLLGRAMETVNIHEAKTQLSRLVDKAAKGEPFVIAKAGKPLVKVMALETPTGTRVKRLGFMEGQITVPDDFDQMGEAEIATIFGDDA